MKDERDREFMKSEIRAEAMKNTKGVCMMESFLPS